MTEPFKNRRKHVRIYRNFILSCHLKEKSDVRYEMSQVNNISQGGINFSVTAAFEKGVVLVIEVKTPFLNDKVVLEGVVLESHPKINNLIYAIRVEFQNLTEQAKDALLKIEQYSVQQE